MISIRSQSQTIPFVDAVEPLPVVGIGERPKINESYLSKSQLYQLTRCAAAYWFRYGEHLKEPQNSQMLFGSTVHIGEEVFFKQRREDPSAALDPILETSIASAIAYAEREFKNPIIWKQQWPKGPIEDQESFLANVRRAIELLAPVWAQYRPLSIEQGFLIRWRDPQTGAPDTTTLPFLGYEDCIATFGDAAQVLDLKNGRKADAEDLRRDAGVVGYALAHEIATGISTRNASYINYVRNKDPYVASVPRIITERDFARLYIRCKIATATLAAGLYNPTDDGMTCRGCAYKDRCDAFFDIPKQLVTPADDNAPSTSEGLTA